MEAIKTAKFMIPLTDMKFVIQQGQMLRVLWQCVCRVVALNNAKTVAGCCHLYKCLNKWISLECKEGLRGLNF